MGREQREGVVALAIMRSIVTWPRAEEILASTAVDVIREAFDVLDGEE